MTFEDFHQFRPFSLTHAIIVGALAAIWWQIIAWSLQRRGTQQLISVEKRAATLYLLLWIAVHGWWLLPANFNPARSLPLNICDIVTFLTPLALIWHKRELIALLYFWGIGFSLQGLLTPDLGLGLLSPWFWLFWLDHAVIVGTAVYMVVVHRFRPTRRDYGLAVRAGLLYLICVFPINAIFGFNYGYLGNSRPSQPTLIDWLGSWPWRVGFMVVLACLGMALLLAPWEWMRHKIKSP